MRNSVCLSVPFFGFRVAPNSCIMCLAWMTRDNVVQEPLVVADDLDIDAVELKENLSV